MKQRFWAPMSTAGFRKLDMDEESWILEFGKSTLQNIHDDTQLFVYYYKSNTSEIISKARLIAQLQRLENLEGKEGSIDDKGDVLIACRLTWNVPTFYYGNQALGRESPYYGQRLDMQGGKMRRG